VDDGAKTGLGLDDDVWDTHLAAQGGDEDDELNGVNVVGNDDKVGLLGLDEGNAVVQAVLDEEGLLVLLLLGLAFSDSGGFSIKTGLLLLLGLGAVLVKELEELGRGVLVEGVGELGDRGGGPSSVGGG